MLKHLVILTSILAASACSKKSDDKASGGKTAETTAVDTEPKLAPLTAAYFGKTPATPPGELAKLEPTMKMEEAKKVSPKATTPGMSRDGIEGVSIGAQEQPEGTIDLLVYLPGDKASLVTEAWGPGQKTDRGGTPITVWFNPQQGIRAALDEGDKDRAVLRFEAYTPVAKLLGEGKDLPFLDKGFEGKTLEELKTLYPALARGAYLNLPATEWEFGGDISLSPYPGGKPIESLAFSIPFKTPEGQAEIMKVIEAKWGKAKKEVPFGSVAGEKTWVYNEKDPHIEVTEPGGYDKDKVKIRIGGK